MTRALGALRAHSLVVAVGLSAVLMVVYLAWQPQTLDLSAQTFRAELWERDGWVVWSPDWYGGFTVPGYSLLYPPLGAWFGPAVLGAVSAVAAAALFGSIALRAYGERAWLGVIWFGLASAVAPFGGRTTFALGLALGLFCVWAVQRRSPLLAGGAGLLTALASPVAGLFVAIACAGALAARSPLERLDRADLPVLPPLAGAIGAGAGLAALGLVFPTDGFQPFAFSAYIWIPLGVVALFAVSRSEDAVLRWAAVIYLAVATVAILHDSPLGGNTVRLGLTVAGPLFAILLLPRRPLLLALLAAPLLWWQWTATVRDVAAADGDPSTERAYYAPLLAELADRAGEGPIRVEVPPTRNRWESAYVAPSFPLARGWLRQLEADDIELFDGEALDGATYRGWLARHGAAYVALSDAEHDYLAEREVELLEQGVPGLAEVWSDEHWRLFEVLSPASDPLIAGAAELLEVGGDRVRVELHRPIVALGFAARGKLGVTSDGACGVSPDPIRGDEWIEIRAPDAARTSPVVVELGVSSTVSC